MVPKLIHSITIIQKIINVHSQPDDEFVRTLDQCVELRRSIIEELDIGTEDEIKEMMLRIPKPTLDKVTQTHIRKLLQTIKKKSRR